MLPNIDPVASYLLASIPEEKRTDSWWIVLSNGEPISGSQGGGIALLNEIQITRLICRLLAAARLSPMLDALDRRFAVWRKWLSQFVPDGPGPRRYP